MLILITMLGGLGIFLLGMKILSEGLQAVSGEGLRKFMALATTHRIAGIGTGLLATMIVQSSSVITVMAVGFVASGIICGLAKVEISHVPITSYSQYPII